MTPLLVLLGAALCSLTVSIEVVPQADYNPQAARGKWYLIGFASNSMWFVKAKDRMKMAFCMQEPTAEGDMDISCSRLNANGSCWRRSYRAKKTDVPGKLTYFSGRGGTMKDVIMVDIKYDEYAVIYNMKKNLEATKIIQLYGRRDEVSAKVKEKFRQFALDTGVLAENIVFLPKSAECPPA